ncbi:ABC transporter permease [Candidatus Geothermarchaeota archaeon]|nr:MAG: ABC transporter permease [Candidatus Geothermarchaeota archaeon]
MTIEVEEVYYIEKRRRFKEVFKTILGNIPASLYIFILFYIPMAILLAISFTIPRKYLVIWRFTIENYVRIFTDPTYYRILLNTFWIVTVATILLIIIGYPIAYYLARINVRMGDRILLFTIIPVEINYLIRIYAWRVILGENGLLNSLLIALGVIEEPLTIFFYSWFAVVIVLIHEWLPYVVVPFYVNLRGIPREIYEAAMDLGASRLYILRTITLPLSKPGILSVVFMVFIPTLGEFAIPSLVGGQTGLMLGNLIDRYLGEFNIAIGATLSFFLLLFSIILSIIMIKIFGYEALYSR